MTELTVPYVIDARAAHLVSRVANARKWQAEQQAAVDSLQAALEATPEFAELAAAVEVLNGLKDDVKRLEHFVRMHALDVYKQTGNKACHPAVRVALYDTLTYEPETAMVWAIEYGADKCLKLDGRAFEKEAKVFRQISTSSDMRDALLNFVTFDKVPRPQLASDLSAFEMEDMDDEQ